MVKYGFLLNVAGCEEHTLPTPHSPSNSTKKVKKRLVAKHKFEDLRMTMYTINSWGGDVCTIYTIELQSIQPIATRCWSSISDQITTLIICVISR